MRLSKPKQSQPAETTKLIFSLASVVAIVAGLKLASDLFIPILLAFFFATISFPILNWLREHKVPRILAVFITILVDFALIAGVVFVGIILVSDISAKWDSKYYQKTNERLNQLTEATSEFYNKWVPKSEVEETPLNPNADASTPLTADTQAGSESSVEAISAPQQEEAAIAGIEQFKDILLQQISTKNVLEWAKNIFEQLQAFLVTAFVVLLITVFMLSEARMFGRRINVICDAKGPNLQRILSATKDIQRYLGIKTIVSIATGLLAGLLCWQMGLEFPLLWGILAFGLNYIPAVGSIIAGIPPILLSLLDNGSLSQAMIIGGGYLLINGILGNFIEPTLLGRRFGISTLVVILSVIFWGWLWGPVGMLMAVPLTMLLKVALDNSVDLRWIAVAIGKETKKTKHADQLLIKESLESKKQTIIDEAS